MTLIATPAHSGTGAASMPQLDFHLRQQCDEGQFSGVVLVIAQGREVYERTCGEADLANHIPVGRQTRFKIYSTSKLITALVVMRLVEEGRMNLDTQIARYLPDTPQAWAAVTLRTLLNHTSGVKDLSANLVRNFSVDYDGAMAKTLANLSPEDAALEAPAGTHFAYNNFGFELLAAAVEHVTGEPFPAVAKDMVFDPAQMSTATFQPEASVLGHPVDEPEDGLAVGYNGAPAKLVQANNWAFIQRGAGAIRASADDFIALNKALSTGAVVKPATLRAMAADPVTPPPDYPVKGRRFGLGIFVSDIDGITLEGHTGGTNGYICDFERTPDGRFMMIALSNRGFTSTAWLRHDFAALILAEGDKGNPGSR